MYKGTLEYRLQGYIITRHDIFVLGIIIIICVKIEIIRAVQFYYQPYALI